MVAQGPRELVVPLPSSSEAQEEETEGEHSPAALQRLLFDTALRALQPSRSSPGPVSIDDTCQCSSTLGGDSFVAIAAVELWTVLASRHATIHLPRLVQLVVCQEAGASPSSESAAAVSVRLRAAEALSGAVHSLGRGGLLPAYAPMLVPPLMRLGLQGWRRQREITDALTAEAQAAAAAAQQPSASPGDGSSDHGRIQLSLSQVASLAEGCVPQALAQLATAAGHDTVPSPHAVAAYAHASALWEWVSLRCSVLSLLGDVISSVGRAAIGRYAPELIEGLSGLLTHETLPPVVAVAGGDTSLPDASSGSDDVISAHRLIARCITQVRRAASLALRLLLDSLHAPSSASGTTPTGTALALRQMASLHQLLTRLAETDPDVITRQHATDALASGRALEGGTTPAAAADTGSRTAAAVARQLQGIAQLPGGPSNLLLG